MSKAKVGDKFIIEIGSVIQGAHTGSDQYIVKGFDKLILDDKGLKQLKHYSDDDYEDFYKLGMKNAWKIASKIMEIPIKIRAQIFNVSINKACFADISQKYTIEQAEDILNNYYNIEHEKDRRSEIQEKLEEFAKENGYTMVEVKMASKSILKRNIK